MTHSSSAPRRALALAVTPALALLSLFSVLGTPTAEAAAPPVLPRTDSSVTADPLPTAQIDPKGWVEDQAIVNGTVYAGGSFVSARPAGSAAGTNESARHNLLSYSLSSGALTGFAPNLNGEVRVLAVSPDQQRIYVGGDFTSLDGATHNHLVALHPDGSVDTSFDVDLNGPVYAVSATDSTVYVGGQFTLANGNTRGRLAAFDAANGDLLNGWTPKTDGSAVKALVVAGGRVIAGGAFATVSNVVSGSPVVTANGSASFSTDTATVQPWAVNKVIKQFGANGSVLSLKTDGTKVYGAGFWYNGTDSNFEGVWAVDPADGSISWLADCHGDTYDTTVDAGVVYTASHHHDCSNIGGFPEQTPTRVEWRGTAFSTDVQGDVQPNSLLPDKFKSFTGYKAPALVNWFPQFANPTNCASSSCSERLYASQPTMTIESSGDYVVMGGQFPTVNGKAQQGLVRFAKAASAPKATGPGLYPGGGPSARAVASNLVRVTAAPWDPDNSVLRSVQLFRSGSSTPIYSATNVTAVWWQTSVAVYDKVAAGGTYGYYMKLVDSDGNGKTTGTTTVSTPASGSVSDSTYSTQVKADGASGYWRLDDAATSSSSYRTAAADYANSGVQDLTAGPGVGPTSPGAIPSDGAFSFDGSGTAAAATRTPVPAPQTFSAEAWFKTPAGASAGGQIIGFGNTATTTKSGATVFDKSYLHDRQVYLNTSGQIVYYLNPGSSKSITSAKSYNDGQFHQVVATLSSASGMVLYVDGAKVSSWSSIKAGLDYRGYWRIGGDNPGSIPGAGSGSGFFQGAIDDVSVYDKVALNPTQVATHYTKATGKAPSKAPNVAFTTSCTGLACSYDASSSTPQVQDKAAPTITKYAWNFGDGAKAAGAKTKHAYKKAQAYNVALTVTNSDGMDATSLQTVQTSGNAAPTASFTTKVKSKKLSVDARKSSDSDGTVAKYAWNFGDGATSTKAKTSHSYKATGVYEVRLTVTDDKAATSSTTRTVVIGKALASDTFARTTSGWGRADKGGTWTTDPKASFAVDGDQGELTLGKAGQSVSASLPKVSTKKANVVGEVRLDKVGDGSDTTVAFSLRQRSTNAYRGRLVFRDGAEYLIATRVVGGQETVLKTVEVKGLTYRPGTELRLRAKITSAKKAKITMTLWTAGTTEPKAQLSTKDSTKALRKSGAVGVWAYQGQGATNAPVVVGVDDLLVTSS